MTLETSDGTSAPAIQTDTTAALSAILEALASALAPRLAALVAQQLGQRADEARDGAGMTYAEAAKRSGLPESALREAAARGVLAVHRYGSRTVRIVAADLDRYVSRRRVAARDEAPTRRLRSVAGGGR